MQPPPCDAPVQVGARGQALLAACIVPLVLLFTGALRLGDGAFVVHPFLQHVTGVSAIVTWETDTEGTSEVFYGRRAPLLRCARVPGLRALHQVSLEALEPGTTYCYRVRTKTASGVATESPVFCFRTAPGAGEPLAFAIVGDTQDQPDIWGRIAARVWGERPQLLVHCGDLVGVGPDKQEWVDEFFRPGRELLAHVPLQSVLGNHEEDAGYWYQYSANPLPEHRYTFRFGDAAFFMVDSNRCCDVGSEQYRWLDQTLAASRAPWRFVVLHHPPFTSDSNDYGDVREAPLPSGDPRVNDLIPLFEKHAVDVVFFGHIHDYERSWPLRAGRVDCQRGTVYVQTGGAGGYLEDFAPSRSWFTAKVHRAHHYCMVSVLGDRLELRAYDIEGRLFDRCERTHAATR